MHTPTK